MIVSRFEAVAEKYKDKVALKDTRHTLTYGELNRTANRAARRILSRYETLTLPGSSLNVGLLFDHGAGSVAALLAVLKARKTYVPLDSRFPGKRLLGMVGFFDIRVLVTNSRNYELAEELAAAAGKKIGIVNIEEKAGSTPAGNPGIKDAGDSIAYILHTSGTSGTPRGVVQSCKNVFFFAVSYIKALAITPADRLTFLSSFSFDGTVEDIYPALLSGASLYPFNINEEGIAGIANWLIAEKITLYHSVPTVFRYFVSTLSGKEKFPCLRIFCMGAEPLRPHDLQSVEKFFPAARLAHMYGQTESSVNTMGFLDTGGRNNKITLGKTLPGVDLYLFNDDGEEADTHEIGEIFVASDYVALGYWKDPEETAERFLYNEELGRLYRSGDLGRADFDGSIEFIGRKDNQVKIRGFRVEPGEIESRLLEIDFIKQAVVIVREEGGENYLCAYIVSREKQDAAHLRGLLAASLPEYMIPKYFIFIDKLPLLANGKLDRRTLPEPETGKAAEEYTAPGDAIEEEVAAAWSEVLRVKKENIGVDSNFFELGGHSLKATLLAARIHKKLAVKLPLADIFNNLTVRGLAKIIKQRRAERYSAIEPAAKKEYYELSSAQRRLYFLQQRYPASTNYNMPEVLVSRDELSKVKLAEAFNKLLARHENLRTSFGIIAEEPVQKIHPPGEIEFPVENHTAGIIDHFVRPFDLSRAPLLRVGLVKADEGEEILMIDMHHIISDGTSHRVLLEDFIALYAGRELPELKLHYKDYCQWQRRLYETGEMRRQEDFWLSEFASTAADVVIPADYPRPTNPDFAGDTLGFEIAGREVELLKEFAYKEGATLFVLLLALYNVLLSKLSGSEDIVIGTGVSGRRHADVEKIIGLFVNTLALRNYPEAEKTLREFLKEVRERTLLAFENQDYQFDELVEKVVPARSWNRNPLFDAVLVEARQMEEETRVELAAVGLNLRPYEEYRKKTSKFDISLYYLDMGENLLLNFEYSTKLFKRQTIEKFASYFKEIVSFIVEKNDVKLADILLSTDLKTIKADILQDEVGEFGF